MRNIKWILFVVILILGIKFPSFAQDIIIQPPLFGPFECTEFYKLYTGSVTNFTNETFKTQLVIEVEYTSPAGVTSKLADGIITGNPSIDFKPGVTIIDNATYESIFSNRKIIFYNKEVESLLSRTKCLPPGQYDVCLTLYPASSNNTQGEFVTQTCYSREKEMLTQLLLVTPFEEEEIKIDLPLFTWTTVTPFNTEAMYRIQIVEMLSNQTPYQAFRANPIFFEQKGLKSNILQYPISARSIPPCTQYAWRVTYELEGGFGGSFTKEPNFLQESEIWTFKTPCPNNDGDTKKENTSFITPVYYELKPVEEGNFHIIEDALLRFVFNHPYKTKPKIQYDIIDEKGNSILVAEPVFQETINNQLPDLPEDCYYGENKFVMELPSSIQEKKPYTLVIFFNGLKQYLRFIKTL